MHNELYYYNNGDYINDKEIVYYVVEEKYTIPLKEKVLFFSRDLKYIITNENIYEIGVESNDKCHTFEDVKCTYTLIKTNKLDDLLEKFKNNISYFDVEYLVTKDNKIYKIEVELKRKDIKDLTNQNITFKYNRKTYLEITKTNDYNDYKKLLKKLKISNDEVLQVIGNDSEQVLINDFSNTYLIGNSSKLLKSFKINKTSSNNLKGFEKVLRKENK